MTRRSRNIWATLGVLFIAVATYTWFFGAATMFIWQAHSMAERAPICRAIPLQLSDTAISDSPGTNVFIGSYKFEVPSQGLEQREFPGHPDWKSFTSQRSSYGLLVRLLPPRQLVKTLSQGTGTEMQSLFGEEVLKSDYAFTKFMLEATPEQIRLTTPRKEAVARLMMLVIKSITVPEPAESGFFSIHTPFFKGFQYGDLRKSPKRVVVDLFDDDGVLEFVFTKNNQGQGVSQADINRVIQTVHKKTAEGPAN